MLLVPREHSPMHIKRIEIKHHWAGTTINIYASNMGETERQAQKDTHCNFLLYLEFKSQVAAKSRMVVGVGKMEGENGGYFTLDLQLNKDAWRKA